jgi:transcriptional regulator with XRE-family HTH domain
MQTAIKRKYLPVAHMLKLKRFSEGYTQAELAKTMKVHVQYVSNWERGLCLPPPPQLKWFLGHMNEQEIVSFRMGLGMALADDIIMRSLKNKAIGPKL